MRVLGLIPARGGSKGVPRKNVRLLCGKPLLQYTAEAAFGASRVTHVVLSTDDEEIAAVGRQCGLDVPFVRPAELARDDTPMLPVVQHAIRAVEARDGRFDAVCLLQPTNPMRTSAQIDACIEMLETSDADSVVTVLPVPAEYNPHWVYFRSADGALRLSTGETQPIARRQALPAAYHREGSVYVARRDVVIQENSLYGARTLGYEVEAESSVNIDDMSDWARAEALLSGALCASGERA
ncbi:MAG TPA: acylneuraminate cytidylyltransferase family protein [Gemmatimonadaceae bacterium]|nr:acylneuraminate cytidylyltransferase family protein [Gemmatimonadaceae bacterium]